MDALEDVEIDVDGVTVAEDDVDTLWVTVPRVRESDDERKVAVTSLESDGDAVEDFVFEPFVEDAVTSAEGVADAVVEVETDFVDDADSDMDALVDVETVDESEMVSVLETDTLREGVPRVLVMVTERVVLTSLVRVDVAVCEADPRVVVADGVGRNVTVLDAVISAVDVALREGVLRLLDCDTSGVGEVETVGVGGIVRVVVAERVFLLPLEDRDRVVERSAVHDAEDETDLLALWDTETLAVVVDDLDTERVTLAVGSADNVAVGVPLLLDNETCMVRVWLSERDNVEDGDALVDWLSVGDMESDTVSVCVDEGE